MKSEVSELSSQLFADIDIDIEDGLLQESRKRYTIKATKNNKKENVLKKDIETITYVILVTYYCK